MHLNNHIFAIEGEWESRLDKGLTIKSTLTLLKEVKNIDFVFRKVNTVESLISYLKMTSAASYKKYGSIVIATHGTKDDLEFSQNNSIGINELADECAGLFENKVVHFSSCSVMKNEDAIINFQKVTRAKCVCGYTKNVDFLESTIFDIALLDKLYSFERPGDVKNNLRKNYSELFEKLGFEMII